MGGYGSGSHFSWDKKYTVEEACTLDIKTINQNYTKDVNFCSGRITWNRVRTKEIILIVNYTILDQLCKLEFAGTPTQSISITRTNPYFGGFRNWFICPLWRNGQPCNNRVSMLHRAPNSNCFGCRTCQNLTYESCQDSHKYDAFLMPIRNRLGYSHKEAINYMLREVW